MELSLKNKDLTKVSKEEIFEIIQVYILDQKELSMRKLTEEDSFSKPSWSEYIAYQLGYLKALNKISTFLPNQGQ